MKYTKEQLRKFANEADGNRKVYFSRNWSSYIQNMQKMVEKKKVSAHSARKNSEEILGQFIVRLEEYVAPKTPQSRTKNFQVKVDQSIEKYKRVSEHSSKISCRKGCAHCCSMLVTITSDEAIVLAELVKNGMEIDRGRLKLQADIGLDHDKYLTLSPQDKKCVFLAEDNVCRIYKDRPMACRSYFVISDPDKCDTLKYPLGDVLSVCDLNSETMISAAYTSSGSNSLAVLLDQELSK